MAHRRRSSRGFSTAEILAGTALTMMLMGAVYSVQRAQSKAFAAQSVYAESQNVTRTVIDLMTRELRMACYDPGTALGPLSPGPICPGVKQGIVEATPSKIHFEQDLTGDGSLVSPGENVTYDVLGSDLRRTDGTALPVTIVSGVPAGGLNFRYFDGSNPPVELVPTGVPPALTASQRDCVNKVRITVRAELKNPDPNNMTPVPSVAQTEVAIRNRSLINF